MDREKYYMPVPAKAESAAETAIGPVEAADACAWSERRCKVGGRHDVTIAEDTGPRQTFKRPG